MSNFAHIAAGHSVYLPINVPTYQSTDQPTNQPTNQPTHQVVADLDSLFQNLAFTKGHK